MGSGLFLRLPLPSPPGGTISGGSYDIDIPTYPRRPRPKGLELLFNQTSYAFDSLVFHNSAFAYTNRFTKNTSWSGITEAYAGTPDLALPWSLVDLQSRLLGKIKNQKVNLGQALGEYRQTARMFTQGVNMLISTYRSIRRGRPPSWIKPTTSNVANSWLCYRYGITPLIRDINGSLAVLSGALDRPLLFSVSTSKKEKKSLVTVVPSYGTFPPATKVVERTLSLRAKSYVEVSNLEHMMGSSLGITNPLSLAWELTPFSFVVDWFLTVGDALEHLDTLWGVKRYTAFYTQKERQDSYTGVNGFRTSRVYRLTRRQSFALSNPTIRYKPSITAMRIADAAALLTQLIPGSSPSPFLKSRLTIWARKHPGDHIFR